MNLSSSSYIVTGGAGFIGSNLCAQLALRFPTAHVVVVDDCSSGSFENLIDAHTRAGVAPFSGEVVAMQSSEVEWAWLIAETRPQAIFHLGAQTDTTVADERAMLERNVNGFGEMLEVAHDAEIPLVYASSAATYGTPAVAAQQQPFTVDQAGRPSNIYGFSKWMMECEHRRFSARIAESSGNAAAPPRAIGLRYFNVFGPGEGHKGKMSSMVLQLAIRLLEGKSPKLFTDGHQSRDQVHVDDVVACTLAAAGIGGSGKPVPGIYNCGSGVTTSFNQIVAALRTALQIPDGEQEVSYFDMPDSIRAFYQDFTLADISETKAALGWAPANPPAEGIASYAKWLQGRHR